MPPDNPITYSAELERAPLGRPKQLIILLHGHHSMGSYIMGRFEGNLSDEAQPVGPDRNTLRRLFPDAHIIAPDGPVKQKNTGIRNSRAWFDDTDIAKRDASVRTRVSQSALQVNEFIDQQCARLGVDPKNVILIGTSGGAITALQTAITRTSKPLGHVLAGLGFAVDVDTVPITNAVQQLTHVHMFNRIDDEILTGRRTFARHGREEYALMPFQTNTEAVLPKRMRHIKTHYIPGTQHRLDDTLLDAMTQTLGKIAQPSREL